MNKEEEYRLFLKNHVLIAKGSRIGIINEKIIIEGSEAENLYANKITEVNGKERPIFQRWIEDINRETCYDIWFIPNNEIIVVPENCKRKYWNTYISAEQRQYTNKKEKIKPLLDYISLLDDSGWLMDWIVLMINNPIKRYNINPILITNNEHHNFFNIIGRLVNNPVKNINLTKKPEDIVNKKNRMDMYNSIFHVINISKKMTINRINNILSYFDPYQKFTENADHPNYTRLFLISKNKLFTKELNRKHVKIFENTTPLELKKLESQLAYLQQESDFLDQVFSYLNNIKLNDKHQLYTNQ